MNPTELHQQQRQAILDGLADRAVELARQAVAEGVPLADCVDLGYAAGIREVGRLWEEGEYFLPELVQGADAMKAAMEVIRPALLEGTARLHEEHRIVLGTAAGDIHDIGKTLVGTVLEANGFVVIDLGRDVADEAFIETVASERASLLGMSALLTTTMPAHARVIEQLAERGLRDSVKVMVGGAPVTAGFAEEIGADGYASSAMEALTVVRNLLGVSA